MAARRLSFLVLVASLFLAGCPSSPPLAPEEIPGDFHFSYEMKVTDEEEFQRALEAEEMKKEAATRAVAEAESEAEAEAAPEAGEEAAPEAGEETAPEAGEETAPEAGEETAPEAGEEAAPAEDGPRAGTEGLPVTYAYIEVTDPGRVKYEVHFGLGNPVKRTGTVDLAESAYQRIYRLVYGADVFSLEKRYIGDRPTGIQETYVVKGNLHWQVIDVKGASVPVLEELWESVKTILLDKESRIFDNPKEQSDVFIIDRRNRCFHRGDCPKVDDISAEYRIRKKTYQECVNDKAWPCTECRPLEER